MEKTIPVRDGTNISGKRTFDGTLKVLAVGNSFSVDAMTYLYGIAKAFGVKSITLGNLYIGGCSINRHLMNSETGEAAYNYYKNTTGDWTERPASIGDGIKDEDWDIITMQQCSGGTGAPESYGSDFTALTDYICGTRTKKDGLLAWHMTWAYANDSTHPSFPDYSSDQMSMYNAICGAVRTEVLTARRHDILIPSGTLIQNLRSTFIGDDLNRDGFHLNALGKFAAGHIWLRALTGIEIDRIPYRPSDIGLTPEISRAIIKAVKQTVRSPLSID